MTSPIENPNLKRRPLPGFLTRLAALALRPALGPFRRARRANAPLTIFESYMVGDFFMALPAIRRLAAVFPVQVVCRPDCEPFLRELGIPGLSFRNAFLVDRTPASFLRTLSAAWALRDRIGGATAMDFDADPRTGFWLRVAGAHRVVSYVREHAEFFDELLPLPPPSVHQADRDEAVAAAVIERFAPRATAGASFEARPAAAATPSDAPWIVSCWTRRDTKNWPLSAWEVFLESLAARGIPFRVLDAPDGDADFARFRERWSRRADFLRGSLPEIAAAVRMSAGVIATDNFLGHMAAYFGKPVFWINGSSDPAHVMPAGPATRLVQVEPMPCRPCGHRCVNPRYKECLETLAPARVEEAFGEWLPGVSAGRVTAD